MRFHTVFGSNQLCTHSVFFWIVLILLCRMPYPSVLRAYPWLCIQEYIGWDSGPQEILRMKPTLAICKTSNLPILLSLWHRTPAYISFLNNSRTLKNPESYWTSVLAVQWHKYSNHRYILIFFVFPKICGVLVMWC